MCIHTTHKHFPAPAERTIAAFGVLCPLNLNTVQKTLLKLQAHASDRRRKRSQRNIESWNQMNLVWLLSRYSSNSLYMSCRLIKTSLFQARLPAVKVKYLLVLWFGILVASWMIYMQYSSYSELCRGHVCTMIIVSHLHLLQVMSPHYGPQTCFSLRFILETFCGLFFKIWEGKWS